MALFDIVTLPSAEPHLDCAGAFCGGAGVVAKGAYRGRVAAWSYPPLDALWTRRAVFGHCCTGVQIGCGTLHCLGNEIGSSFEQPRDWQSAIKTLDLPTGRVTACFALPPGNWRMVKARTGDRVVLFDVTEGQGLMALHKGDERPLWTTRIDDLERVRPTPWASLIGLSAGGTRVVEIGLADGAVLRAGALAGSDEHRWTCVLALGNDRWLMGGRHRETEDIVVAMGRAGGELEVVSRSPLADHFSQARIEAARDDAESCGFDLASVAELVALDEPGSVAIAIGGNGESLDSCHSACAVGILDVASGRVLTDVVDDEAGCAGMIALEDGAFVLDCGGTLRVLRRTADAAVGTPGD